MGSLNHETKDDILFVRNPITGECDYEINNPSEAEVAALCRLMRKGQADYSVNGITFERQEWQSLKAAMTLHKDELIKALTLDTGRKRESILEFDLVMKTIERWYQYASDEGEKTIRKTSSIPFIELEQELIPYPLVAVISPWNFPLLLAMIDTIPALIAGCSVIVKPSEVTPRFASVFNKILQMAGDIGKRLVFMNGDGRAGSRLIDHVDLVCFTGSVATGRKVYQKSVDNFIPCFLELGGKDAAIVLEGAHLELASSSILWGSTANAGQSCLSIERVYVQKSIFGTFISLLKKKAEKVTLNSDDWERGHIGPIISEKQISIINEHLQDAFDKGAVLVSGWPSVRVINGGYYLRPTILTQVNHDMKVMQEETFGPIISVMEFDLINEAIRLANDTIFGLSAAVFAQNDSLALEIGRKLEAGAISINDCALTSMIHEGEKNAFKQSGIGGTRMGMASIKRFYRNKVYIIKNQEMSSPWWFEL